MIFVDKKIDLKIIELDTLILMILFYLYRTTVPFFKFPFILLLSGLILLSLFKYKGRIRATLNKFSRIFFLSILLFAVMVFAFFNSNKLYLIIFKDIINASTLLFLFFFMTLYIKNKIDLTMFLKRFIGFIIFFAVIISIRLLFSFLNIFPGTGDAVDSSFSLTAMSLDNNFATLPVFFGFIGVFYLLPEDKSLFRKIALNSLLILFSFTVIASGSRRGLITLTGITSSILLVQLFSFRRNENSLLRQFALGSRWYIMSIIILLVLLMGIIFIVPVTIKRSALNKLGIPVSTYKQVVSNQLYKYGTFFTNRGSEDFLHIIWPEKPDPKFPDSGWATKIGSNIFPLYGKNSEIIPDNSTGFKMDKKCNASTWVNNAYSYTDISMLFQGKIETESNEFFYASVYCYVSEDFDGTWARIAAEGKANGKVIQEYDMTRKGEWQKLSISFKSEGEISPVYLYWAKFGCTDFTSLKGYVIYAYPEYKTIKTDPKDPNTGWGSNIGTSVFPLTGNNSEIIPENSIGFRMDKTCNPATWDNNAYSFSNISCLFEDKSENAVNVQFTASVFCFVSNDFDGTWVRISAEGDASGNIVHEYDLRKKGIWQKLQIEFTALSNQPPVYLYWSKFKTTNFSSLNGYVIFAYPQYVKLSTKDKISKHYPDQIECNPVIYNESSVSNKYLIAWSESRSRLTNTLTTKHDCKTTFEEICHDNHYLTCEQNFNFQNQAGLFPYPFLELVKLSEKLNQDIVRRFAAKLISEDTTYYAYKKNLEVDTITNKFIGERIMRWQFAVEIFKKEYNLKQKLFGGGFNFLSWFGFRFLNDKTECDYPHNPFLTIILYTGIIGLIIYLVFFLKIISYYIKRLREYYIFAIFFIITFFFSFFSAGSPFDPPVMGFFSILPFFINYISNLNPEDS